MAHLGERIQKGWEPGVKFLRGRGELSEGACKSRAAKGLRGAVGFYKQYHTEKQRIPRGRTPSGLAARVMRGRLVAKENNVLLTLKEGRSLENGEENRIIKESSVKEGSPSS